MIYRYSHDGSKFVVYSNDDSSYWKLVLSHDELDHLMRSAVEFMRFCGRDVVLSERVVESPLMEPYEG